MATINPSISAPSVIVVGPDPSLLGGMSAVVGQILGLEFDKRYQILVAPITLCPSQSESVFARIARHVAQLLSLWRQIRHRRAVIVHLHTCSGFSFYRSALELLFTRSAECRVVLHIHGAAFDEFYDQSGVIGKWIIRRALTRADSVVALSDGWRRKLRAMAPDARIAVIENAIEAPQVKAARKRVGPCRFLMLARMDEWKGVDDLLNACAKLRAEGLTFELALAGPPGTAGDDPVLNRKIRERGLEGIARYVGPVQGEEKRKLLEWADVYVQPSHCEGMPLSLLEALAYGLAVVATRVGAVPEVIEHRRCGLLVPPNEPNRLASAMAEVASDAGLRKAMAQAGRELIQMRFSLARFRDDLLSLYDEVLALKPCRRRVSSNGWPEVIAGHSG